MMYPNITLTTNTTRIYEVNKTGELQNAYSPLQNLATNSDLGDFTTSNLKFDKDRPVDIIITDEYDGSQNIIINDDVNDPKLINTRMSVQENKTFLIPEHTGNSVTNVYDDSTFDRDASLLKLYDTIPQLVFNGLEEGGTLQCGSYTFYFKLSDSDGNLTNTIQESGPVTVHIGTINSSKVRMGMEDEDAAKSVSFTLKNLDSGFDYVRVFFERSSSDNSGALTTLYYMIDQNYPIIGNTSNIVITGGEQILGVSKSDLQNEFADIAAAKTQTILQNILFLGNVQSTAHDYNQLQQLAWRIIPKEIDGNEAQMQVGGITGNYGLLSTDGSQQGVYYNVKNQYYYTGYWPDEYYRFGVVFIFNNNLLSPVFNIQGVDFQTLSKDSDPSEVFLDQDGEPFTTEPEDYIFKKEYMTNSKGVVRFSQRSVIEGVADVLTPKTYGITFDLSKIALSEGPAIEEAESNNISVEQTLLKYGIKGLFFVRQKRIPSIIAQGLVIGLTGKDYGALPVIKNQDTWSTYSFLSKARVLHAKGSEVEIHGGIVKHKALLVPDFELNTATFNSIFTSQNFSLQKVGNVSFTADSENVFPKEYNPSDDLDYHISKVTGVPQGSLVKTDGENYFATLAGSPEEPYKTEDVKYAWNSTPPQDLTTSTSVVRGKWGAYVGISYDGFKYGDLVNIKSEQFVTNPNQNLLEFQKRFADSSFYSAISTRYNYNDGTIFTCYRGDCFPSLFTHRMMSNFQDPELPTNHKIVDPGCWAKNYAVRCTAEILGDTHSNLTDDSAGWYIPSPVKEASNIVSLVFGILSGNIGTVINAVKKLVNNDTRPRQTEFSNEIVTSFEVYTGVNDQSEKQKTYDSDLYSKMNKSSKSALEETVAEGWIKKVNPKEQEQNATGGLLKSIFKAGDKWELHGLAQINRADVNAVAFGQWITFPICSPNNLAFRDIDFTQATEEAKFNKKRSFYPLEEKDVTNTLNESQVINGACKKSISQIQNPAYRTTPFMKQEFFNRIYWSKPNITDNVINSYRMVFRDQYKEYNKEFGAITKLESLGGHLIVVFEHGIGLMEVNRSIGSEADATPYLASRNVLPAQVQQIITPDYGSMWKDSVLKVPDLNVIFGVDTVARKIWMLSTDGIKFISDNHITKFLNDFIDLSEYDFKEYQGHINVKTHYNAFKKDVMFTYYKDVPVRNDNGEIISWEEGTNWSICYNISTGKWTTFYDWIPVESCNIDNIYFSFDRDAIDAVLNQTSDDTIISKADLYDSSGKMKAIKLTKALIDPQFFEKCDVYNVTSNTTYDVKCSAFTPTSYLCYYEKINNEWVFKYNQSQDVIEAQGDQIADIKYVHLKDGVSTQELERGPMRLYNLRNSTPNRMLLWKHGQAGLYDNQGKIKPTFWYGKQHEFNFEFVVNESPAQQKIFNNLKILSNKTAPDKFEFEIVGEGYEWFEYKPIVEWINKQDMSIKTLDDWYKEVLNKDSATIRAKYPDFPSLFDEFRIIKKLPYLKMKHTDKKGSPERPHYEWEGGSAYWDRFKPDAVRDYKYSYNCSEPCFVADDQLNETRVRTEQLGNDMRKYGRIRGNMQYLEDLWDVEIRPLQLEWCYVQDEKLMKKKMTETRHRDKYLKVKVRYSGEDLALIQAIMTIFDESYA